VAGDSVAIGMSGTELTVNGVFDALDSELPEPLRIQTRAAIQRRSR
jgi:hypothetical protein